MAYRILSRLVLPASALLLLVGAENLEAQVGAGTFGASKLITALAEGATTCTDSTPVTGSGTALTIAPTCSVSSSVEGGVSVVANGALDIELTKNGTDLTRIDVTAGGDASANVLDENVGFTKSFKGSADVQGKVVFGAFGTTGYVLEITVEPWSCQNCSFEVELRENGSAIGFLRIGQNAVDTLDREGILTGGGNFELRVRSTGQVINLAPTAGVDGQRAGSITVAMTFPEAEGACCTPGGACLETTLSSCQAIGEFQGFGTLCAVTQCGGGETFVSWANGAGGAFETPGNWEPAAVPDGGDSARFNLDAAYPVSVVAGSLRRMLIDKSVVSLSGGQLSLVEQSLALPSLGIRGGGQLNLLAGSLVSSHAAIGDGPSLGGIMSVEGASTSWQSSGRVSVGQSGLGGLLTIEGGAAVSSAEVRVGDAALGLATVTGENSIWTTGNFAVALGAGVSGNLSIRDGGVVEADDLVSVGEAAGADGSISIHSDTDTFAELETFSLRIGGAGNGSVTLSEGGALRVQEIVVSGQSPGTGTLTVSGPQAEVDPPLLYVVQHDGVFEMETDADIGGNPADGLFGAAFIAGSAARVTIRTAAEWALGSLRVGESLDVEDSGGQNGIVEILDGATITARDAFVGVFGGASATVRVKAAPGSQFLSVLDAFNLIVGGEGAGSVTVEDGGAVDVLRATVRGQSPGSGRLTVTGSDASFFAFNEYNVEGEAIVLFDAGAFVGDPEGNFFGAALVAGTAPELAVRNGATWLLNRLDIGGPHPSGTNGTVRLANGTVTLRDLVVGVGGTLTGIGTVERVFPPGFPPTNALVGGTISPGISIVDEPETLVLGPRAASFTPGVLTIGGNVVQGPAAILRILGNGPGQAGVLHVTGVLTLGGTLEIAFPDGYLPATGDAFAFVQADGGVQGSFDRIALRGVAEDLPFSTNAIGGGLTFTALADAVACSGPPGDDGVAACERCDDCVDDDGDGLIDRADPDCAAAANGLGLGAGGDATGTKMLLKCGLTIATGGAKLGAGLTKALQACADGVFACVQTKPGDAGCLAKARAKCAKATGGLVATTGIRAKFRDKVAQACGLVPSATVVDAAGLGYGAEAARCAALGVPALTSLDAIGTCIDRAHVCRAVELFASRTPRARELLTLGGAEPSVLACLPVGAEGNGAGLGDAKTLGKPAVKCQQAIAKAGAKLTAQLLKGHQTCGAAVLACAQQGSASDCVAKAAGKCVKAAAGRATVSGSANATLAKTMAKACGGIALADLQATAGLGFTAGAERCAGLGVPTLGSLADVATCLSRDHACRAATLAEIAMPRSRELLTIGGVPLP